MLGRQVMDVDRPSGRTTARPTMTVTVVEWHRSPTGR